ncbi:MAG: phosphatidate cytidylyltransferase [Nitrospirota bacterium]|nr:phosphatidate cytidylyltransferase [Nitrospirota bacterium]
MNLKRLVIALIVVPVLYSYVMYLPPEYFLFLLTFFSTIGLAEFYAMYRIKGPLMYSGLLWGAALLIVFFASPGLFLHVLLIAALATMALRLFLKRDPAGAISSVSAAVFGLLYVPCLMTFQLRLVREGAAWIVLLYASVWAADSMAYYVGKGIGKRKLYPEISPNKTVAGAVGSLIGGVVGAALITATLLEQISPLQTGIIGLSVGLSTMIGDLVESMFKRDVGVKDSSHIVPGHGGVLDKLDGVTFAGPVFYWVCLALGLVH